MPGEGCCAGGETTRPHLAGPRPGPPAWRHVPPDPGPAAPDRPVRPPHDAGRGRPARAPHPQRARRAHRRDRAGRGVVLPRPSIRIAIGVVAELGQRINRPDLGVWVWKDARPGGDLSTFDLAYPRLPANSPLPPKDWVISHAIARQESSFDRTALSSAGARGLMQLMPATASDVAAKLGLPYDVNRLFTDPAYNLTLGSYYIGLRRDNFSNGAMAIAAYNAGAGNVRKWIALNGDPRGATTNDMIDWVEMIPIQETRNYVQRVSENAVVYSLLEPKRFGARPRVSEWLKGN